MVASNQFHRLARQQKFALNFVYLSLVLLLGSCASTLSGNLITKDGLPVSHRDARVNLISLNKGEKGAYHVLEVDEDGRFSCDAKLSEGLYLLESLVPGFRTASMRFHLGETHKVQLQLEPLPAIHRPILKAEAHRIEGRAGGEVTLTPPEL